MTSYKGNPDAVRVLVQPDRVHRDLCISPEIFTLEQEYVLPTHGTTPGMKARFPSSATTSETR